MSFEDVEVLHGSKLPKTERAGETPLAPVARKEELVVTTKRRRTDSLQISFGEYSLQARPLLDLSTAVRSPGKPLPPTITPTLKIVREELLSLGARQTGRICLGWTYIVWRREVP